METDDTAYHASGSTGPGRTSTSSGGRAARATRSNKPPPKLKLKVGERGGPYASGMSFLGPYDRELDTDAEDDLIFEEQFILRVPEGSSLDRVRKIAESREATPDISFKFRDSRRGVFTIGNKLFNTKLVDLPNIIESHKTLDKKALFKVADISQMLVLEDPEHAPPGGSSTFNVDEFIWNSGITPPLKRTIETVEAEVERLLQADADADKVQWNVLENVNPDLSDSEFINERDGAADTPAYDASTPMGDDGEDGELGQDGDDDDEMDALLAQELEHELRGSSPDEEDEDAEESEGSEEFEDEDDEEGEDDELEQGRKRLNDEIRDLEAAIAKKQHEVEQTNNPVFKSRFADALKKLQADRDMKLSQRDEIAEERARRRERKKREEQGDAPMDVDLADDEDEADEEAEAEAQAAAMQQMYDAGQGLEDDIDGLFGGPDDDD
ncbi:TAFII55 protein conserved region-domain-containing protein [Auriculariales sp. MPI-PUGE-AT-0066]|nr:TAFII55 protein conserved region-domain-containing protein [Auriculariales sp. MPI-PUGE-AT-0066]